MCKGPSQQVVCLKIYESMETHASLNRLSALLNLEIRYANTFRIPYIMLAEKWVLTESFENESIELNDLETYTWHEISEEEICSLAAERPNRFS